MANKNGKHLQHLRSNLLGNVPNIDALDFGEIAINYAANGEKIFIKNTNNEIISFSSDNLILNNGTNLPIIIAYSELPEEKKENTLYLLCLKDEIKKYIWINEKWEFIGNLVIDLDNVYTKSESNNLFLLKSDLQIVNELGDSDKKIISQKYLTEILNNKPNFPPKDNNNYCINNGKWVEINNGIFNEKNEKLKIILNSNHLNLIELLNGKIIEIVSNDDKIINQEKIDSNLTFEFSISENTNYKINLPDTEFFQTPLVDNFIAIGGNNRELNLYYKTKKIEINIENQNNDDLLLMINNSPINVNDTTYSITKYLPSNKSCNIILKRNSDNVILYANNFNSSDDVDIQINAQLKLENVILIDQSQNKPIISGDINGDIIRNIRENTHRVLGKKSDENTMSYIELSDTNSNYYFDGTEANLNGEDGDVFVKLPTFYYKGVNKDENNIEIHISYQKLDSDFIKWDGNKLIGAYELSKKDDKYYSCSNEPIALINSLTSLNRGQGYKLLDWQTHNVIGMLFIAYYGDVNSQNINGWGVNNFLHKNGLTNELGMIDSDVISGNEGFVNFWGLENWWGRYYEFISDFSDYSVTDENKGTRRNLKRLQSELNAIPLKLYFGQYVDLIPLNNTYSTENENGYCDYMNYYGGINYIYHVYILRSSYQKGFKNGIFSLKYNIDDEFTNTTSRLCFYGITKKITNVDEYKNIKAYD